MTFLARSARFVPLLLITAALNAAPPNAVAPVRVHGGTVVVKSQQHATIFLVRNGDVEGPAEHLFQVWSNPGLQLNATYRGADVEYSGSSLVVVVPSEKTVTTFNVAGYKPQPVPLPEGFSTTTYDVFGMNHVLGRAAERYTVRATTSSARGRISTNECTNCDYLPFEDPWGATGGGAGCTSGGMFATSCSQSGTGGSCSVTCSGNSYACCKAGDPPSCSCFSN
jgi:hypothetical protein